MDSIGVNCFNVFCLLNSTLNLLMTIVENLDDYNFELHTIIVIAAQLDF